MEKDVSGYDVWTALKELRRLHEKEYELTRRSAAALGKEAEARREVGMTKVELDKVREEEGALRERIARIGAGWRHMNEFEAGYMVTDLLQSDDPAFDLREMLDALEVDDSRSIFLRNLIEELALHKPRLRGRKAFHLLSAALLHHAAILLSPSRPDERNTGTEG